MITIKVHCDEGSDRNCHGLVDLELPFTGITENDINIKWKVYRGRDVVDHILIYPPNEKWIENNSYHLNSYGIDAEYGMKKIYIPYSNLEHTVCDACGSDQDYDEEGNNISAL